MRIKSIMETNVRGKRVLLREDLNVPLENGAVADETRIRAALPTLRWLHEQGARTVIISHLGRPDGEPNPEYSLRPVAARLAELLGVPVQFVPDCVGDDCVAVSHDLSDGAFALFENLRFHPEEEANDPEFARQLAYSGDLYCDDAFGAAHRAHASTARITQYLAPYAGLLMQAELDALGRLTGDPAHPFVCAIGGAKVVDKIGVLENLIERVDAFVIGGGMANTLLAAQGIEVGRSLRDPDLVPAQRIIALALSKGVVLHLPTDAVVADAFDADATARTVPLGEVGRGMILDIGPATAQAYAGVLRGAKTIVFNGPMGVYERAPYREGTRVVGEAIAEATRHGATSVVGGGDAAAAAHALGFAGAMTHVSTGGGATLELLEGKTLPGVKALER